MSSLVTFQLIITNKRFTVILVLVNTFIPILRSLSFVSSLVTFQLIITNKRFTVILVLVNTFIPILRILSFVSSLVTFQLIITNKRFTVILVLVNTFIPILRILSFVSSLVTFQLIITNKRFTANTTIIGFLPSMYFKTGFIQAILCKIQGLFKDFSKTFLQLSRTENFLKILIYKLKFYNLNARVHY